MSVSAWLIVASATTVALYLIAVVALIAAGRGSDARALAGFIPDCIVLVRRLIRDPRVPRRRKALLGFLAVYLALPFDLIPDFVPVAGQLDDVLVTALVLRVVLRSGGPDLLREHWRGPERSFEIVRRATFGSTKPADPLSAAGSPD